MLIRDFTLADAEQAIALWQQCDLTRPWNDPLLDIERNLTAQPGLSLVAEAAVGDSPEHPATEVVGTVMLGYDGHRGWMYYLASHPKMRGQGIAKALVAEAERRFESLGCPKAQLMVRGTNTQAVGFYQALGYEVNDVLVLGKRLIEDD
ncbi:GNAT family acetyltransferase [Leucobacter sp. UT-8R-CII-1-4]|uniref:GNAT family acetyltransferase n=1 Tax=Leucobacter sp. UT-8R-CII-1-4 TaxID=3040075 RepID=UPI0024A902E9|nr:GNAT family acetyltransferase [Leucobacter sp. UT-8R-CII-1-4]MDI6022941.1 GNAT family acetyltransferase [Leucobacter sp. UT-8R-CII-1-4]